MTQGHVKLHKGFHGSWDHVKLHKGFHDSWDHVKLHNGFYDSRDHVELHNGFYDSRDHVKLHNGFYDSRDHVKLHNGFYDSRDHVKLHKGFHDAWDHVKRISWTAFPPHIVSGDWHTWWWSGIFCCRAVENIASVHVCIFWLILSACWQATVTLCWPVYCTCRHCAVFVKPADSLVMVLSSCCCWFFFSQACIYRDSVFNELADSCVKWATEFLKPDKDKTGNNKASLSVCLSVCFSLFLGLFLHMGFCTQNNVSVCLSGIDTSIKLKVFKFTAGGGGGGEEGRMEQVGYVCVWACLRARACVCVCVCVCVCARAHAPGGRPGGRPLHVEDQVWKTQRFVDKSIVQTVRWLDNSLSI